MPLPRAIVHTYRLAVVKALEETRLDGDKAFWVRAQPLSHKLVDLNYKAMYWDPLKENGTKVEEDTTGLNCNGGRVRKTGTDSPGGRGSWQSS